jgi:ligand-binding sensor domain-containing protein
MFDFIIKLFSFAVLFSISFVHSVCELKLDDWKTYTSMADVKSIDVDHEGKIWAGTSGGVFIYDGDVADIREFRNTEGLLSLNISCVSSNIIDKTVFIGSSDGVIQIYDLNNEWKYITDIMNSDYSDASIYNIKFDSAYAYIGGGFGLSKFDLKDNVFVESVERFGDISTNMKVYDIFIDSEYIWVASDGGVARIGLDNSISNPKSWELFPIGNSSIKSKVSYITLFKDSLFVASKNQIYKFEDSVFVQVQVTINNAEVTGMSVSNNKLVYSTKTEVFDIENQSYDYGHYRLTNGIYNIHSESGDKLIVMFRNNGFSIFGENEEENILPNTPITNNFVNLDVDKKGRLWVATKSKAVDDGTGFMMLDEKGSWTNFTNDYDKNIFNNCLKINALDNGKIYVSTWGTGLLLLTENDGKFEVTRYDTSNSPLTGAISDARGFVITGEVLEDDIGRIWIINYGEGNPGPLLICSDGTSGFNTYNNNISITERGYLEIAEDIWGTKWLGSHKSQGLFYYNDNRTTGDKADDVWGRLTKSNSSLLDNEQTAIVADKNGFIWIGTPSGLNFIYNSYSALTNENINVSVERYYLKDQYIHDIYIDALDNKWIATNKGIWVLNEDGSEVLNEEILNSSNSPLIHDEVFSITSDASTGRMYFGTKYGLSSAKSLSVKPVTKYDIKCYPQPFNPMIDDELFIDGLKENSDIRILTIDGYLVKALSAKGRIAIWDGRDESGSLVSSGVYIVVSSSETTEGGGAGKFTVIRK